MATDLQRHPRVLVIGDVEEIRDGIERLLRFSGYLVTTARDEACAVLNAGSQAPPDLILISTGVDVASSVVLAQRIREAARLGQSVPVVVFCVPSLPEGAEENIGNFIYLTRPDNFDQLRGLIKRLLS